MQLAGAQIGDNLKKKESGRLFPTSRKGFTGTNNKFKVNSRLRCLRTKKPKFNKFPPTVKLKPPHLQFILGFSPFPRADFASSARSLTLRFTEVGHIATTFADDGQHLGLVSVEVKPVHAPPTPNTLANSCPPV